MTSASIKRVQDAAQQNGLDIEVVYFEQPAKTAKIAADLIGCSPAQIANSLIFEGRDTGELLLLLTSGVHRVDLEKTGHQIGQSLTRANPNRIRTETGFAIGGVSPIGHKTPIRAWIDSTLFQFDLVWAAAGRAETVFSISPGKLQKLTNATELDVN